MSRSSPGPKPMALSKRSRMPRALGDVLAHSDVFAGFRAGVAQVSALSDELRRLLPDYLAANVEPGAIRDGTLTLFAAHNALAARLRHLEPTLLAQLQQRGFPLRQIKIRVRPQPMREPIRSKQARMSATGAACLHELAQTLEPGALQQALARMAARHGK